MLKVAKSSLLPGRSQTFERDTVFRGYPLSYPLLAVESCHYVCKVGKVGDYAHASYAIEAVLRVEDSRDGVPFAKPVSLKEDIDILEAEDDRGEGYLVNGPSVDLDDLALRLLASSLPIRLVRDEGEPLPESGPGYRVLREGEAGAKPRSAHSRKKR